jgi:hypothetical protein
MFQLASVSFGRILIQVIIYKYSKQRTEYLPQKGNRYGPVIGNK